MSDEANDVIINRCECGAELEVSVAEVGQTVTCGVCGRDLVVTLPEALRAPEAPAASEREWFFMKDNGQIGPVSESEMHELFKAGTIGGGTLVWTESMQGWAYASSVSPSLLEVFHAHLRTAPLATVLPATVLPAQQKSGMPVVAVAGTVTSILAVVAIIGILAAIMLPALARARESARRALCANNLKQAGLIMQMFAAEHKGRFPTVDNVKGNFIFEGDQVFPEYLSDFDVLGCPSDPGFNPAKTFRLRGTEQHPGFSVGAPHPDGVTSESYAYLGWAVTGEEEGLAALDAYRRASEDELDSDLSVPEGRGNGGGSLIFRLDEDIERRILDGMSEEDLRRERFKIRDINHPATIYNVISKSAIPTMWEWPSSHIPTGANVLYLDGHVEFIRYPGQFPMTEAFIEELRSFEPQFSPDVEPIVDR